MGAAWSDMITRKKDVSKGYSEFYGLKSIHELASHGRYHEVSICLKKGANPNEKSFPEDDKHVSVAYKTMIVHSFINGRIVKILPSCAVRGVIVMVGTPSDISERCTFCTNLAGTSTRRIRYAPRGSGKAHALVDGTTQ